MLSFLIQYFVLCYSNSSLNTKVLVTFSRLFKGKFILRSLGVSHPAALMELNLCKIPIVCTVEIHHMGNLLPPYIFSTSRTTSGSPWSCQMSHLGVIKFSYIFYSATYSPREYMKRQEFFSDLPATCLSLSVSHLIYFVI